MLVSEIDWLDLEIPAFIRAGETYWFDEVASALIVEAPDGHVRSFPASWPGGPGARR